MLLSYLTLHIDFSLPTDMQGAAQPAALCIFDFMIRVQAVTRDSALSPRD